MLPEFIATPGFVHLCADVVGNDLTFESLVTGHSKATQQFHAPE